MEKLSFLMFREHSSLEYALLIASKGSYKGAARDITYISVPGRNGDLLLDNGRYQNITIPYTLSLINTTPKTFTEISHQIKGWLLSETGYFRLWDSYDSQYFRWASYSGEANVEQELKNTGTISLSFTCKPYKYSFDGLQPVVFTSSGTLYNAEFFASSPYIKITGSGDITLSINNDSFVFADVDEYIEIDSEAMNAYKGIQAQNSKMTSDGFPRLTPGENSISWVGDVEKVEIIPRWCCL